MRREQRIVAASRPVALAGVTVASVTVASVAGAALAIGVSVQPPPLARIPTARPPAEQATALDRALRVIASNAVHQGATPSLAAGPCVTCHASEPAAIAAGGEAAAALSPLE